MEVATITQHAFFAVPPAEVFAIFTDADLHRAMSGGERAEIEARVGGRFDVFDGAVTATFREILSDRRIVQTWRERDWPSGHHALLELRFVAVNAGRGTHVQLTLSGVPESRADATASGWRDYYWVPISEYLRDAKLRPVRRFVYEFKNHGNLASVDEILTQNCEVHLSLGVGECAASGRELQKAIGRQLFAAFSDVHVEVEDQIVEGDRVVQRQRATAVHTGEFLGIAPTGRKVHWTGNHIYRIANGQIAEAWSELSLHDLLAQLSGPA
jgi:uncharacterized protein YndB with AHSA1/START domain/ketosteroid isomerase-like protein